MQYQNLSLCSIKYPAISTWEWWRRGMTPRILNFGSRRRWSPSLLGHRISAGIFYVLHWTGGWINPRVSLGALDERKLSTRTEFEPWILCIPFSNAVCCVRRYCQDSVTTKWLTSSNKRQKQTGQNVQENMTVTWCFQLGQWKGEAKSVAGASLPSVDQ